MTRTGAAGGCWCPSWDSCSCAWTASPARTGLALRRKWFDRWPWSIAEGAARKSTKPPPHARTAAPPPTHPGRNYIQRHQKYGKSHWTMHCLGLGYVDQLFIHCWHASGSFPSANRLGRGPGSRCGVEHSSLSDCHHGIHHSDRPWYPARDQETGQTLMNTS